MRNIKTLEKNLKLSGNIRNPTWVTTQFNKKRISIGGVIISEHIFNQYKICMKVISDIYENAWDVAYNLYTANGKICIDIRAIHILFEEITITNSLDNSHVIKDLLVAIELRNDNNRRLKIDRVKGGRLYLSYAEYQSNYFHSHLSVNCQNLLSSGIESPFFTSFCTGSGEINIYQSNINGDGLTESNFTSFAMQIMTLVNWESLEGMPYRRMETISVKPTSGNSYSYNEELQGKLALEIVLENIKQKGKVPDLDIIINSNYSFEIVEGEKFNKLIESIEIEEEAKVLLYCSEIVSGGITFYYRYNQSPGFTAVPNIPSKYIFRNVERSFIVEAAPTTIKVSEIEYKLHPKTIIYIKNKLQNELNKNRIRQSTINRYQDKPSNAGESVQSNPVPVSGNS